jgi:hypothetical protein
MSTSTNQARTARLYGTIGAIAAVAVMPSFVVDTNKNDVPGIIGGIGLIIGMLGLGALAFGYRRARATVTKAGSVGLYLLAIGPWLLLASITLSEIVNVIDKDNLLQPLAGLLILVGGLTAGVSVARARVLDGWRRWALLVQAIAYVLTVAIMIAAGEHPSATVNALGLIWPLSALGTALALRTSTDRFATLAPVPAS